MDLRSWIIGDLKSLHTKLGGGVVSRIPPQRCRERADGGGVAPVYVLWHLARHHDVAVNGAIRNSDQVVTNWSHQLGISEDFWRGLAEGEDTDLVDVLDPEAVGVYALDVIDNTGRWLASEGLPEMDAQPDTASTLASMGTPQDRFGWLYGMWDAKPNSWFLQWSAVGHGFNHLGELISIRNRMGLSPF